jgi:hypothetical protein
MGETIRRRQPRAPGGRRNRIRVQLSDADLATLTARAEAEGLTVAHYLVRTALGAPPISARAIMLEFTGIRRLVATATNNLNQVARHANSGSYDVAAHDGAVGQIETAVKRLNDSISKYGIGEKNRP